MSAKVAADLRRPRIGVSQCLLGDPVRYDGGHRRSECVADLLARRCDLVPVCPEVELGLGVPRETIQLVRLGERVHLMGTGTGIDHTDAMEQYAQRRVRELVQLGLSGFVFKRDSPSCGVSTVRVLDPHGTVTTNGRGLFAVALLQALPHLPITEEDALFGPGACDDFLARVALYQRRQS
ncbi:MAG: DUF523 domain-containing protein [Myxococcota bacterium]